MSDLVKVSVILPSLNVVKYIEQCIKSVIKQSLKGLEIICVDAGSTDGTLEILQRYALEDSRIKILLSEKKSYGYQVNIGIRAAKGKYVAIVDTDDMIKLDMYESLYSIAEQEQVDFVKADYEEFKDKKNVVEIQRKVNIVGASYLYNTIIDITKIQQCMHPQITATWSGIYKKSFLEENCIKHNETYGASYQDAGFFLQSYMYAKRAYFVNQPFYMYRVDNPNSSVVNKSKVYCICDEFNFVWNIVNTNKKLQMFKGTLSWIFYKKYKRNVERIAENFRFDFFKQFAEDFNKLKQSGLLSRERFSDNEWNELTIIREKAESFYTNIVEKKAEFINMLTNLPQIIIYGEGKVGKDIYNKISQVNNVICFAVTEKKINERKFENVDIKCIEELIEYKNSAYVVIAVMHSDYQKEMVTRAKQIGFDNIITIPFGVFDY